MDLGLAGKRVIVTGASKGIGRAIAQGFLDEKARVAICARGEPDLADTARELATSGEVHHRRADMAEPDGPADFVDWAVGELGGIDVLVSNVSGFGGQDYRNSVDVDIVAAHDLIRSGLEHMKDDQDCNIICIGSRAGNVGIPWMGAYAAVKAATVSMVKSLALEVARRGIRVNVVSPGDIRFPGGTWEQVEQENPKLYQGVLRENPFRRLGRPRKWQMS